MGARHSVSNMPASMALAMGAGIAAISRASGLISPVRKISTAATRNAPATAGKPPTGSPTVNRKAMPGVVQAKLTGTRKRALTTILRMPMAMHTLIRPDPACCGDAPAAVSAASTSVNVLAYPTMAASAPAINGWKYSRRRPADPCTVWLTRLSTLPGATLGDARRSREVQSAPNSLVGRGRFNK